ncbi:PEP-CTERM sorting domain-containing protein [bacterium]|nr:PEP-CTERM sorting domain-containing protein [bacterium]
MQRRLPFVIALTALCFFQAPQIQAQVLRSRVDRTEASPLPFNETDGGEIEGKVHVPEFFDGNTRIQPAFFNPLLRYEIYGLNPFPVINEGANIAGPVIVYEGGMFDQFSGFVRSLEFAGEFSNSYIGGGTVAVLNPGSGGNGIFIDGGNVAFGSYSTEGIQTQETTADWQSRVSALDTPTNAGIFVTSGTVNAGIASGSNGDLSLGTNGFFDVSGGRVEATFGDVAGRFDISGGVFPNLSVNSLSGEINILGNDLQYQGTTVDSNGLQIDSASAGGEITGTLADGSDFIFALPEILDGGSINLFANNSALDITPEETMGLVNGGGDFAGGVEVSFDIVEEEGTFTSDAQMTDVEALAETIGVSVAPDFELASEESAQHWELGFDGMFVNEGRPGAELVFGYDELSIDVAEEDLAIFHFDELSGQWEELEVIERDLVRNSLRVRTSSFSPFVLGAVTTAVPEPSSAVVLMALMMTAALRRRS